jgi:Domain of unknown function (DUF4249)
MNYLKIILVLFILSSCETLVDDLPLSRFPELKSKLVLTSFISPQDSVLSVRLSQSTPLFGEYPSQKTMKIIDSKGDTILIADYDTENIIDNAQVIISNGKISKTIPFNISKREYLISTSLFPIEAGKTYTLSAKTKELYAEATTTIPLVNIPINKVRIDSTFETSNRWEADSSGQFKPSKTKVKVLYLDFDWSDLANQQNYFKMEAFIQNEIEVTQLENGKIVTRIYNNNNYANWGGKNYDPKKRYMSDVNLDGKTMNSPRARFELYPFDKRSGSTINGKFYPAKELNPLKSITIKLFHINNDFYQNQLSLENVDPYGEGNPFKEPVQVYSNVKNGLGCFGGYIVSKIDVKF